MPTHKLIHIGALSLLSLALQQAQAACNITPTAGNDTYVCDSGSAGALNDASGNNSLTLPAGGTGTIASVTFGPGTDRVRIDSGTITGAVQQGSGIDDFIMNGGQIQSLAQGDGLDTFLMTGGVIEKEFVDGDIAKMTGGTIGRVDMKLDDNTFDMSGGKIAGNLVTGFGTDTIIVSGSSIIGGNISVSGGNDSITVTGGEIRGQIRASEGDDTFVWKDGGTIKSAILMGNGNDTSLIGNLTESQLSATPSVDGGLDNDQLTFDNSISASPGRYIGWESVNLNNNSRFDLAGDFFLGDSGSGTGAFTVDGSSKLAVTQGNIRPYTAGQLATLNNAGIIDMTTGSNTATDSLTVHGSYVGNGGQLWLQTVLADDTAASDKLVVSQGTISGNTLMTVTNLNGPGAATLSNGIEVVQAQNGATSSADAFSLKGGSISAGAYEYRLFKGGVSAGSENSWYLRNSVVAVQPPVVPTPPPAVPQAIPVAPIPAPPPVVASDEPPVEPATPQPVTPLAQPAPAPVQAPAQVSPTPALGSPVMPTAVAGADPIPTYRIEVPVYSVVLPSAQLLALSALGTFHDRQGEQSLLTETGGVPAGWARVYGGDVRKSWSGDASPSLDGSIRGFQVGHDLYAWQSSGKQYQRVGFFVGQSRLQGNVDGFAEGFQNSRAGKTELDGDNVGVYWSITEPLGWYLDFVAMYTSLDGNSRSERGVKLDTDGHEVTLSAEAGYPIKVSDNWVVEPQAQVINQRISLDDQNDGISDVSFDSQDYWTGRLGARLKGRYLLHDTPVEPYLRANAWRTFGGYDTVTYNDFDRIKTEHKSSSADVGFGVVTQLAPAVSVYASIDYNTNLDSNNQEGTTSRAGVRISW